MVWVTVDDSAPRCTVSVTVAGVSKENHRCGFCSVVVGADGSPVNDHSSESGEPDDTLLNVTVSPVRTGFGFQVNAAWSASGVTRTRVAFSAVPEAKVPVATTV